MSKYTTEVRFICESLSGNIDSQGANDVDKVIAESWEKIFSPNIPFFEEEYRPILCQKILRHYYLREIGAETYGIWKMWLNTRMSEIMPYYNQLYKSTLLEYKPLEDVNVTRTHKRTTEDTKKEDTTNNETSGGTRGLTGNRTINSTNTDTTDMTATNKGTNRNLYSDTPQGTITGLENENYLTNARKVTDDTTGTNKGTVSSEGKSTNTYEDNETTSGTVEGTTSVSGTVNGTEDFSETITGKQGGGTFSAMLKEYRETLINVDMMVIENLSDLFMNLW